MLILGNWKASFLFIRLSCHVQNQGGKYVRLSFPTGQLTERGEALRDILDNHFCHWILAYWNNVCLM